MTEISICISKYGNPARPLLSLVGHRPLSILAATFLPNKSYTSYEVYTFRIQLLLKNHVAPTTRVAISQQFYAE